jgi:hypothetical protein
MKTTLKDSVTWVKLIKVCLKSIRHLEVDENYVKRFHFIDYSLHYIQVKGTDMGTRMAPYYDIFMGSLEEDFLNSEDTKPDIWFRFIDIILLWTHGHDSLLLFLECLNTATLFDLIGPSLLS